MVIRPAGVVFDLDGVLIFSRNAHRKAFEEILGEFGISEFNYDNFAGWRTPEVFRFVFEAYPNLKAGEEIVAACSARKSARARALMAEEMPIATGCVPVLQSMSQSYRLALASSGSRPSVEAFLDHTGLRPVFVSVLSGDDVRNAKPDPELFVKSIHAMGLAGQDCVVVEDAPAGVVAARLAGATAIGMGLERSDELRKAGAGHVVDSLAELVKLMEGWRQ